MDMLQGMMGGSAYGGGMMFLAWINWILLTVLLIAAIRWLWNHGEK
ncbi:hypothetical protein HY374_03860 [Candidatus Berkelbacteria bacterium]|nr:hypothetical protein [Candidatus Berkelbacteria bacterium]